MKKTVSILRSTNVPLSKNYPLFRFIGGNVISFMGDQIYMIALPLMVLSVTGSPISMGIVSALERLPVLAQPLIGILSDRFSRKRLLLIGDGGRFLLTGWIGFISLYGNLHVWQLYIAAFGIGLLSQVYNTSQFATVPSLVSKQHLQLVNSINTGALQTATLSAPAIGGLIISLYHPGIALLVNSFSFFIAFAAVASIQLPSNQPQESRKTTILQDLKEGFHFVLTTKAILFTNLAMLFSTFGTTLLLTLLVFHLKDTIHLSSYQIGWLLSGGGAGAIAGALFSGILTTFFRYRSLLFSAAFTGGLSVIVLSQMQSFFLLLAANMAGTFMVAILNPCLATIRQTLTPFRLLGRVQATSRFMAWILLPVAALSAGLLADLTSTGTTLFIGGTVSTLASFFYLHPSLSSKAVQIKDRKRQAQ
ncbi:MFS transporter [Sediminibacillus dalangtanensis]|uniref:MFS transporter n=1 Tax=Sediminibacillus dalangtanensis TaxID=2729421 RepID=A0ABX7VQB8_9BACI|nr:MFS transporter [Sediminibacillus dalangtanensis]QTM97960.1 MFS transporter [Sediminibacillus dalangtanensis]